MSAENWRLAAAKYRVTKYKKVAREFMPHGPEIEKAARDLEDFLISDEGQAGLELLDASCRYIGFADKRQGFDDYKPARLEADGLWISYWDGVRREKASARFIVLTALGKTPGCPQPGKLNRPDEVVPFIRATLDEIAQEVPGQGET